MVKNHYQTELFWSNELITIRYKLTFWPYQTDPM